jgi:hypothetical protein
MTRFVLPAALAAVLIGHNFVSADWPVFRGDALMTGTGTAKLPDKLEERWTFKTGTAK